MNIIILTDICEHEYEYKFFPHKKERKKDMFMDWKNIKVFKLLHISAIPYNLRCLFYNNFFLI